MEGWIIDSYTDTRRNKVVFWIKGRDVKKFEFGYTPSFHIGGSRSSLDAVGKRLKGVGAEVRGVTRKAAPSMKLLDMLEVRVGDFSAYHRLAEGIYALGGHSGYTVYDADIPMEQRYMLDSGVFPMAFVSAGPEGLKCLDSMNELYYEMPDFNVTRMEVTPDHYPPSADTGIRSVTIDDEKIEDGEERMLFETARMLNSRQSDIILTSGGDSFAVRQMYRRASLLGIEDFTLGRERGLKASYAPKSYMSYGRILYKPSPALLKGRIHIDTSSSFLHVESGLEGLTEVSRLSYIGLQQMARLSPGTAISSMETMESLRQNAAVPWKKNRHEAFKSAAELVESDRGGLIYTPVTGFHKSVYGLDFSSLYPSIMKRENISVDTLNCACCVSDGNSVPGLGYHFCTRRTGLIPLVIGRLIERRRKYKTMDEKFAPLRRNALKWVLVTSFGYTGYRNAKFGSIECHESINAFGREILLRAAKIAEGRGFRILHGIVDSLWIEGGGDIGSCAEEVERETGIPFDVEGKYRWIVFLNNKGDGEGSLNKYYGLFDDGTYKLRGIELRRSDTPGIVRMAQNIMLEHLRDSADREDFVRRALAGIERIRGLVRDVRLGNYPMEDMVITRRVSKRLEDYSGTNEQRKALVRLKEAGVDISAGQVIRYVVSQDRRERNVVPEQLLADGDEYEPAYYTRLIARALSTMLLPFGYTEDRVLSMFRYCS